MYDLICQLTDVESQISYLILELESRMSLLDLRGQIPYFDHWTNCKWSHLFNEWIQWNTSILRKLGYTLYLINGNDGENNAKDTVVKNRDVLSVFMTHNQRTCVPKIWDSRDTK